MHNDLPALRLVTPPDGDAIHKTAGFLADYFSASGWQVQQLQVEADAGPPLAGYRGARQQAPGLRPRTLSLSPFYTPAPGEQTVYWLLDSALAGLQGAAAPLRERCARNFRMSKVLAASNEGRQQLLTLGRHIDVLPPPPFVVSDILPGPYRQALVLEAANGADQLAGAVLAALPQLRHNAPLQLQLAGFAAARTGALQQQLAPGPLQVSAIDDMATMIDAVRHALAYVVIGMRGAALEVRAEIAAAARRPLLVFGALDAGQLDFFASGVSGFHTRDAGRLTQLLDLLAGGQIDASRLGDNALRLLLSHRQPERTLKEYLS